MKKLTKTMRARAVLPEKVLQFGEGNFLRAFIDWMFHRMNETGVFNGSAVVVQPLETGLVETLNEQDALYTLYLRGIENGETLNQHELITSVSRGLNPYAAWDDYLATARNPAMRYVVSNTTESGIAYVKTAKPETCPASFPAKLTAWLAARFDAFGGSAASGMVFLPCELINHNGAVLKECILKHSKDWKLGADFEAWIENDCTFLSTLVDRIVPGYPRDEAEAMSADLGYEDQLICTGELFHLLVIEGPEALKAELPFHEAGLNVVWTDDMQPYRNRKVGILNGAHTASVLASYLGGLDTVREMMQDDNFGPYVKNLVFDEIVPALPMDRLEAESFAAAVVERFLNPFIRHELLSISLNSVSKWKVRVLPSVKRYIDAFGKPPALLSFSLAALIAFYKGGLREGYAPNDDPDVLEFFSKVWKSDDATTVVHGVLSHEGFWGEDLTRLPGLEDAVAASLELIIKDGSRDAIKNIMGGINE
ncbi:tagaturonate reductase [Pontiella sulfatireligans]|uniref:Altronate oxidoreductase n=1 Tax=Pontiella sulfatireligans TaxID=2750658 RepID=A0A6C2UM12_9BACT|nr:tagaturonate reductase [Pontiella sulfatireligans]VGO20467.1 Altronate oxidoreductase [Pontiella sulfatireligans]